MVAWRILKANHPRIQLRALSLPWEPSISLPTERHLHASRSFYVTYFWVPWDAVQVIGNNSETQSFHLDCLTFWDLGVTLSGASMLGMIPAYKIPLSSAFLSIIIPYTTKFINFVCELIFPNSLKDRLCVWSISLLPEPSYAQYIVIIRKILFDLNLTEPWEVASGFVYLLRL